MRRTTPVYRKRTASIRNIWLILFFTVLIVGCGAVGMTSYVQANDKAADETNSSQECLTTVKYYQSVKIHAGDTPWSIAEEHMDDHYDSVADYMQELKALNNLDADQIHTGQYLTVIYYQ